MRATLALSADIQLCLCRLGAGTSHLDFLAGMHLFSGSLLRRFLGLPKGVSTFSAQRGESLCSSLGFLTGPIGVNQGPAFDRSDMLGQCPALLGWLTRGALRIEMTQPVPEAALLQFVVDHVTRRTQMATWLGSCRRSPRSYVRPFQHGRFKDPRELFSLWKVNGRSFAAVRGSPVSRQAVLHTWEAWNEQRLVRPDPMYSNYCRP